MTDKPIDNSAKLIIAEEIRDACIEAAGNGFRDAKMSGLCNDGAIEAAVGAMQSLDLEKMIEELNFEK
jgi:hypothetical protein